MNNLLPSQNSIDFIHPDVDVILNLNSPKKKRRSSLPVKSDKKKSSIKAENLKPFTDELYLKIKSYLNDLKDIDSVVPYCQEKNRKELLLDRGLLLCLKVNEIIDEHDINLEKILNYKNQEKIDIDKKILDENFWMNQKVDKYARTEQRKVIPQERWFMLKDNNFTPNLKKCFELNRNKFIDTYNWLNSLENNNDNNSKNI